VAHVAELHVYPVHGEPGQTLEEVQVEAEGLAGDRRKKAPVHVVASEDTRFNTRANVMVAMPPAELAAAVGGVLRLGEVELDVTGAPSNCPGVYASVRRPGLVRVGDMVTRAQEDPASSGGEPG
jgi:uncharacterized protein YcbX